jgi:HPt (histidine-containing phosphotransfer) domain-containing protein
VIAIDPAVAAQLAQDLPPGDFRRILATFEADLTRLSQQIEQAAISGDWDTYHRASHSLAGAAAAVGAASLEQAARVAMDPRFPHPPSAVVPVIREWALATVQELGELAAQA